MLKEEYSQAKKYRRGIVLAVLTPLITGIVTAGILAVCYYINIVLGCVVETIMCYQILAVKSLKTESMKVYYALKNEGIPQARQAVSMIVGRDTSQLDEHGITRAAFLKLSRSFTNTAHLASGFISFVSSWSFSYSDVS